MDRKTFIRTCGMACLGLTGISMLATSCAPVKYAAATTDNNRLKIALSELSRDGKPRSYILVKAERMDYPIVVYRFSDKEYKALLLKCTHQHAELSVYGNIITCQAHGSEFDNKGEVLQGPADQKLQSFPVSVTTDHLFIHLS